METLTYTVAGRSIKLDYSLTGSFLIEKIAGLTAADIETGAQRGYGQNGYTLRDMAYGARHINVNFLIVGTSRADLYKKRQLVSQVFNPLLGVGELVYTNDANARAIKCLPTITPTTVNRMGLVDQCNVELTCNDPFWYDVRESSVVLRGTAGGLRFPLHLPTRFSQSGGVALIDNVGDVPAPVRAVYRNTVNNPRLSLVGTDSYIQVDMRIPAGDTLIVTTGYGNKNVVLQHSDGTTESAFHAIDVNSTFFELPLGKSRVDFAGVGEPTVTMYWRNYYVGV